jgi:putative two-component system response regulator
MSDVKVLIADDDPITLQLLERSLTRHGYQVVRATDGREALEKISREDIQLVVSDWEMPHLNGVELCQQLRASGSSGYVYVILLTGRGSTEDAIRGLQAGADDFVTKPFNSTELIQRVRTGERILSLESRDLTIFALAKLAESRDQDTGSHLERVRSYSQAIAETLVGHPRFPEVDAAFVRTIYQTSPLHDIGKVAIPDSVLLKRGKLTDEEYAVMKSHAAIGADTLDAALNSHANAGFLTMARDIAATHHEKWDGSGYPSGLSGCAIPACGRIVAVADVYDALTTERVYKPAFSHEKARQMIVDGAGSHFDPDVVEAFLACEQIILKIAEIHRDDADLAAARASKAASEASAPKIAA